MCQVEISFPQRHLTPLKDNFLSRMSQVTKAFGYSRTLRSRLPPVWQHSGRDDVHRQDLLRPESHHAGGRLGGLQRVQGAGGAHRECGLALRHHHPGLQRAPPAAEQVPPSAGGPGFSLQSVWIPGELLQW